MTEIKGESRSASCEIPSLRTSLNFTQLHWSVVVKWQKIRAALDIFYELVQQHMFRQNTSTSWPDLQTVWCETCLHGDCSVITGDGNSCTVTTVRRSRRLFVLVTDIFESSLIQRRHLMSVEK